VRRGFFPPSVLSAGEALCSLKETFFFNRVLCLFSVRRALIHRLFSNLFRQFFRCQLYDLFFLLIRSQFTRKRRTRCLLTAATAPWLIRSVAFPHIMFFRHQNLRLLYQPQPLSQLLKCTKTIFS
jgi:hypothetical protein